MMIPVKEIENPGGGGRVWLEREGLARRKEKLGYHLLFLSDTAFVVIEETENVSFKIVSLFQIYIYI